LGQTVETEVLASWVVYSHLPPRGARRSADKNDDPRPSRRGSSRYGGRGRRRSAESRHGESCQRSNSCQPTGGRAQLERAIAFQADIDAGRAKNRAAIARREALTRARITQIMTLLKLPGVVQAQVLSAEPLAFTERQLRAIAMLADEAEQQARFEGLLAA